VFYIQYELEVIYVIVDYYSINVDNFRSWSLFIVAKEE